MFYFLLRMKLSLIAVHVCNKKKKKTLSKDTISEAKVLSLKF